MKDFLSQAAKLLKEQKQYRRRVAVFLCLAVIVGYGTVMALKLYGQAMNHKMEVLDCQYKVHEHTDECYELDEEGNRISEEPVCGYADYVIHVHNDSCYDKDGELVCPLEEHELHEHTEECYVTETVLICGETAEGDEAGQGTDGTEAGTVGESPAPADSSEAAGNASDGTEGTGSAAEAGNAESTDGAADSAAGTEGAAEPQQDEIICGNEAHKHDESCYENVLNCGYAEEHVHTADCISHELICEIPEHTHGEACYDADGNLVCGMEEHTHEIGCFDEEGNTLCNTENHIHDESCLNAEGKIACGPEGHEHIIGCYRNYYSCGKEAHVHSESCYTQNTICGKEEHEHGEECYAPAATAVPEENGTDTADSSAAPEATAVPEATAAPESGEAAGHVHTDACYQEVKTLVCGEQDELHIHDNSCYTEDCFDEEGNLIEGSRPSCGLLQLEEHTHTEDCIKTVELTPEEVEALNQGAKLHIHTEECCDEEGNLICGYDADHVHMPECYDDAGKLICGYGTASHVHEDKCYDDEGNLICGYETAKHPHTAECYDAEGNLQCGYETDTHVHDENCYDEDGNVICGYEAATHVHQKECYDAEGNLQCGYETAKHEHEDSCYDEAGNLICGYNEEGLAVEALYCDESIHTHDESCYDENGNLICGKADFVIHTHTNECYNVDGLLICPLPEIEAHTHSEECYRNDAAEEGKEGTEGTEGEAESTEAEGAESNTPVCGREEIQLHTHTDECYDENGVLVCGQLEILEHMHSEACQVSNKPITRTFEGESFIVTATYKPDAEIPEEAELIAEQITEESDSEHYAKREAEYQEALGDDKATMRALLKIGFYVNGEEVEPKSPVTITVQFLNEDGLAEGKEITVIHFADEGTELLEGSEVENGSTTFEMESFSEIAVGYGVENVKVPVNEELKFGTDEIEVIFHIEGEVSVPLDSDSKEESEEDTILPDKSSEADAEEEAEEDNSGAIETETENTDVPLEDTEGETATDSEIAEGGVSVEIQNTNLEKKLEFRVDPLKEDSEEYIKASKLYSDGIEESIEENPELLFLEVVSYGVVYDGKKLDLTDCIVTAEVMPSEALVEYAETALTPMTLDLDNQEPAQEADFTPEVTITVASTGEDGILDGFTVNQKARTVPTNVLLGNKGLATFSATSQANPKFTVQYYAYIQGFKFGNENQEGYISILDTTGKNLPVDGKVHPKKYIQISKEGVIGKTEAEEIEIYSPDEKEYVSAPGLVYFNKVAKNPNYILKEIKVLRKNETKWEEYSFENGKEWHFTNKQQTKDENKDNFILITSGATIRLIYDTKTDEVRNPTKFYDYDISDGKTYLNVNGKTTDRGNARTHDSGPVWYMYTNKQGINDGSKNNGTNQTFGFGNANVRTGLTQYQCNKANVGAGNVDNGMATFGLATKLEGGKIKYKAGLNPPNLFNDGDAHGKQEYDGGLIFSQEGDTYTLIRAEVEQDGKVVSSVSNLDSFKRQQWNSRKNNYFAANDFYPMDNVKTGGSGGHDLKFGSSEGVKNGVVKSFAGTNSIEGVPVSDDGLNHNHYFGMYYTVEFDLVKDYVGPLEYLFYGDDDMWVFLDGPDGNDGKLICDIGGVHSSIGEYVNLWDYIKKGEAEGHYKLSFYYTERGASGSTCWMQFTLPSVTFATTKQDTGMLRIEKEVTGPVTSEVFGFEVEFKDKDGNGLKNDYSYTKYNDSTRTEDNPEGIVESDILIWNNSKFTLKAGEYIIISFLPEGAEYTITEVGPVRVKDRDPGEDMEWEILKNPYDPEITKPDGGTITGKVITGTVTKNSTEKIQYNNVLRFALPETGGFGTILYTMAGGIVVLFGAGFLYRNKKKFRERRG